jgi:hypothetical protein
MHKMLYSISVKLDVIAHKFGLSQHHPAMTVNESDFISALTPG